MNEIRSEIINDNIVIFIPTELLKFAEENRESPYVINDMELMAKYVVDHILEFSSRGNYDEGYSDFYLLLDGLFDDAYENGQLWLDLVDFEEG